MNENLNLVEILKDCPKGTKLYSPVFGDVEFVKVCQNDSVDFPIEFKLSDNSLNSVTTDGRLYEEFNGECILFPSKDQRDWSKFTSPRYKKEKFDPKTLKPFDKVLVRDTHSKPWRCSLFSHIETDRPLFPYATCGGNHSFCIPYNDDTKHLVGTKDEAPEFYRYWEDKQ